MSRITLNLIMDVVAFVGFMVQTTTGNLLHFVLIPGSWHRSTIWYLNRHEWGSIHFGSGFCQFNLIVAD